jgi:hypothetical protein
MTRSTLGLALLSAVMAGAVALLATRGEEQSGSRMRIGAPDDTGGIIVHAILERKGVLPAEVVRAFDAYPLKDCCASTSQWALGSHGLDAAVMCPDAAERLLERDPRFEILGPCVLNSEVMLIRPGVVARKIGLAQKRRYQERLVMEKFGAACAIAPMLPASLPYAYARGMVDGIVIDLLKGFSIEGEKIPVGGADEDVVTYVLVARKDFMTTALFDSFLGAWEEVVAALGDMDVLLQEIERYRRMPMTGREKQDWVNARVRFLCPRKAQK